MTNLMKIGRLSRALDYLALFGLFCLPIFSTGYWLTGGYPYLTSIGGCKFDIFPSIDLVPPIDTLSPSVRLVGFLIGLIPMSISMAILLFLSKLFKLYQRLSFFTLEHVKYFRKLGYAVLCSQLIMPFYDALMTFTLVFMHSPENRVFVMGISSINLQLITVSFCILLISWIMEMGYKLQQEQAHTV